MHHTEKKGHFAFPSNDVIVMHRAASLLVLLGTVFQQALWFILVDRSAISFSRSTHLCQLLTSAGWESLPFRAVQQIQPLLLQGSQKTASNNPWSLLFQLHFCQFRETLQSLVDKHWPADWCGVSLSWREHRTGRRSFQFTSWSTFQPLPMVTNSGWKTNKWDWGYKLSFVGWLGSAVDIWRELGVEPLLFHAEGNQLRWFKSEFWADPLQGIQKAFQYKFIIYSMCKYKHKHNPSKLWCHDMVVLITRDVTSWLIVAVVTGWYRTYQTFM